jgi:hypothetical protein
MPRHQILVSSEKPMGRAPKARLILAKPVKHRASRCGDSSTF